MSHICSKTLSLLSTGRCSPANPGTQIIRMQHASTVSAVGYYKQVCQDRFIQHSLTIKAGYILCLTCFCQTHFEMSDPVSCSLKRNNAMDSQILCLLSRPVF